MEQGQVTRPVGQQVLGSPSSPTWAVLANCAHDEVPGATVPAHVAQGSWRGSGPGFRWGSVVARAYDPSIPEAEAGESQDQDHLAQLSDFNVTLF